MALCQGGTLPLQPRAADTQDNRLRMRVVGNVLLRRAAMSSIRRRCWRQCGQATQSVLSHLRFSEVARLVFMAVVIIAGRCAGDAMAIGAAATEQPWQSRPWQAQSWQARPWQARSWQTRPSHSRLTCQSHDGGYRAATHEMGQNKSTRNAVDLTLEKQL